MAYKLKLPTHWCIHKVFHVSLLKPYKGDPSYSLVEEDPPEVEKNDKITIPKRILRYLDNVIRSGKVLH